MSLHSGQNWFTTSVVVRPLITVITCGSVLMALLTLSPLSTDCDTGPGHTGQPGPPSCHTALTSHISLLCVLSLCDNIDNNARCHVSLTPDMDTGNTVTIPVWPPLVCISWAAQWWAAAQQASGSRRIRRWEKLLVALKGCRTFMYACNQFFITCPVNASKGICKANTLLLLLNI